MSFAVWRSRRTGSTFLLVAALVSVGPRATRAQGAAFDPMARGRLLTRWFMAGQLDSLDGVWNDQMSALMKAPQLELFYSQVKAQVGDLTSLQDEHTLQRDSIQVYTRLGTYAIAPVTVETQWAFDPRGKVAGFYIRPAASPAPTKYLDYVTKTALRLPFDGDWYVVWGGRVLSDNIHVTAPDQRFAYDLLVRKGDSTHSGEGKRNEDYFCFGQPVLTPGPGTIVAVADTVSDNAPGVMNRTYPLGNHVIIDHGNGEYSFLCHFKRGTVAVKPGQKVKVGDKLGECGNSGNSSEPHLHYHMQTTAMPLRSEGLPAQFLRYNADGSSVERGEPTHGQVVSPLDPVPAPRATKPKRPGPPPTGKAEP